jgi:hypothetical protein
MIPRKKESDILQSAVFVEEEMDIAEGQKAWIFDILRNKTYKDKIGSPLREYVANALDAHAAVGREHIPVEVTFPTAFSNEVRVRDYGDGLSDADVVKFFAKYGASNKRESNKFIGAFGIGCKSAFAYTDSFTIVSYLNGTKTTFNMYIDATKVGKIARLTSNPTDEPNGVEIVIPVKPQDVSTFVARGLALMKYFKTQPVVKGVSYEPVEDRKAVLEKDNWKYFGDGSEAILVVGQIGYPIDVHLMGQVSYGTVTQTGYIAKWERSLLDSGFQIEVPIGSVELTASREELEMNNFTVSAIRAELAKMRSEIIDMVSEQFNTAKTLIEAKTAFYNFFFKGGSFGNTLKDSIGVVKWNGLEIRDINIPVSHEHKLMQYTKKYNGDIELSKPEVIKCTDELNLYFDDTDRKLFMYKRRAKTLLDAGAKAVWIIQTDDKKAFKKETGLDVSKLPKYSTVVPTILASTKGFALGADPAKKVKHKLKVFELDWNKLRDSNWIKGPKSDYWKVAEIEIDKQIYIPIERFHPKGMFDSSIEVMRNQLKQFEVVGIDVANVKIYGVKAGQDVGEMVRLDEWMFEQAKTLSNLAEEVALVKDYQEGPFDFTVPEAELPSDSLAYQYRQLYSKAQKLMEGHYRWSPKGELAAKISIAELIKLDLPDLGKLKAMSDEFEKRYPLMLFVHDQQHNIESVVEYIKLIDEARAKAPAAQAAGV